VLAVVYLFSFKGLVFTCSASRSEQSTVVMAEDFRQEVFINVHVVVDLNTGHSHIFKNCTSLTDDVFFAGETSGKPCGYDFKSVTHVIPFLC
jgi:hypothetical protein